MSDGWNPDQYQRFHDQRLQPVIDLIALVETPAANQEMRAIDLGCGTGEPTILLAQKLPAGARVVGIDSSPAMLEKAAPRANSGTTFALGDIGAIESFADYQLVFSNAALHWLPDQQRLFATILGTTRPGAQVAIQMPFNQEHPSHRLAEEVAQGEPFAGWLGGFVRRSAVLALERYAELFFAAGFNRTSLFEKVYLHPLPRSLDVTEWVKGTLLIPYLERLSQPQQEEFLAAYRARLVREVGDATPYPYTFRRMFLWGVKSG